MVGRLVRAATLAWVTGAFTAALATILIPALTLTFALPAPASAAEVQVAFDPAGRIQRVDEPLARRIGLFVDSHPGFQEARLFAVDDSTFVLEISVAQGGQFSREREVLTREQADALRADVSSRVAALPPERERVEQGGRATLVTSWTLLGLGFYGWAFPYSLGIEDGSGALGSYMLVSGASFFGPLLLTKNQPVTWGPTNLSLYGATRGIFHGWLIGQIAEPEGGYEDDGRTSVGLAMATSVTEGILGYAIAQSQGWSAGHVAAIEIGGDYGMLWGFLAGDLMGYLNEDEDSADQQGWATLTLGGAAAGLFGGEVLGRHRAYSFGDVMIVRGGSYVGILAGTAFADLGNPENSEPYSAGIMAGSLAGLIAGDRLVAGREFTVGEGVLVQLGGLAGGLMGLGLVALTETDDSSSYWFGTATGAAVGYTATYAGLASKATARASKKTSWQFNVAPEGLLAALQRAPAGRTARSLAPPPPLVRFSCAF